ncbi:MAG: cytochrome c [Gemmatimonadetes bacterium]|nr:cytochrome c [Gemmatimonadota bacterium]
MRFIALVVVTGLATSPVLAQDVTDSTPPGRTTVAGVYTAEQAENGAKVYRKNCTACHAPVGYTGLAFRRVWNGRTVFDFYDLVRSTMPNDEPGKLSREEYADIMAYLLKLNGLPSGEKPLPNSDEELKLITISIPPKAPNP